MPADSLRAVNEAAPERAAERFAACNASPSWVAAMVDGRPYADAGSLLERGEQRARALPWEQIRQALDAHPRIGERAEGATREATWSRQEQAAVASSDDSARVAFRAGNAAYERRFGHVFLIRAAGRSPEEMLGELRRRLDHDDERERDEVREQLAQITRLRLERMLDA
jgi:2-oxo-4-hydroxy-4-carboxy-5-ureidoimidazoline decarboxylase